MGTPGAAACDFVVIGEVQGLTAVQLTLVLACVKAPGQFLLCGDSNQIVHSNFFSWAAVKTLFWYGPFGNVGTLGQCCGAADKRSPFGTR